MHDTIESIRNCLSEGSHLGQRVDAAFRQMQGVGFDGMIYDYTPMVSGTGADVPIPSVFEQRNLGDEMRQHWSEDEYIRLDPVQRVAMRSAAPFCWSYDSDIDSVIRPMLTPDIEPVMSYLREREVFSGVTVPIHLPNGDFATVTGVSLGRRQNWSGGASRAIADLSLIAHLFNQSAVELLGFGHEDGTQEVRLTPRERECLTYAALGNSAKETARIIDRSVPTVVMHLNAAMRKLGARNRTHAVTIATRRRLI